VSACSVSGTTARKSATNVGSTSVVGARIERSASWRASGRTGRVRADKWKDVTSVAGCGAAARLAMHACTSVVAVATSSNVP
jgi:hypothetical protein